MRRTLTVALGLGTLIGALAACGDEDPTGVGGVIIGPGVTTFEVVLEAGSFLQEDTTYDSFGELRDAGFRLVANDFAGELDAHTLFQIGRPYTVSFTPTDSASSVTDSIQSIRGARVTLVVDTVASTRSVGFEVLPVTESWDGGSVTWQLRYDTAGVSAPWTQPGGTTGPVVGSATWEAGDTLVIQIDSAGAAVWQDSTAAQNGALIRAATPGSRVRIRTLSFQFDVVPRIQPDTVLTAGAITRSMHIASPDAPPVTGSELRVGGLPAWRTLLHFEELDDLVVNTCTGTIGTGDPECDVPLRETSLSLAALLLDPVPVGGHRIELPTQIEGRAVLPAPNVPVFRSPLSGPRGFMLDTIPVELFTPTAPPDAEVAVPITGFVRDLLRPDDEEDPEERWLALVSAFERSTFGYMAFASMETATPPRLRLILTVPNSEVFD